MPATASASRPGLSGAAPLPSANPPTGRYQAFTRHVRGTLKLLRPSAYATHFMSGLFSWNMRGGKGKGQPNRDLFSKSNTSPYEAQTHKKAFLTPLQSREQKADVARQRKRERQAQPDPRLPKASKRSLWGSHAARGKSRQVCKADGKPNRMLGVLSGLTYRQVRRRRTGKADVPPILSDMPKLPAPRSLIPTKDVAMMDGADDADCSDIMDAPGAPGHNDASREPLPRLLGAERERLPSHADSPAWSGAGLRGTHREQRQEYRQLHALIAQRFGARSAADLATAETLHRDLLALSSLEEGLQCGECEAIVNKLALASGHDIQLAQKILMELGTTYDIACNGTQVGTVDDATWRAALLLSRDAVGLGFLKRLAICRMQANGASSITPGGEAELPRQLVCLHETWRAFLKAREWLEHAVVTSSSDVAAAKAAYDRAERRWIQENRNWREQEYALAPRCDAYRNFLEAGDAMCSGTPLTMSAVLQALSHAAESSVDALPVSALVDPGDTARQLAYRVMQAGRQALQHYGSTASSEISLATRLGRQGTLDYFMWNQGFRDDGPGAEFMRAMAQLMKTDKYAERAAKRVNGEASDLDPRQLLGMKKTPFLAMGGETYNFQSALAQADRATYDKALLALAEYKVARIKEVVEGEQSLLPERLAEYAVQLAVVELYQEQQAVMEGKYKEGEDGTTRVLMQELPADLVRQRVMGIEGSKGTLQKLLDIQKQSREVPISETLGGKQRDEPVVIERTAEPDADMMKALDVQLSTPIKLCRAQLEAWLPQLAEEARAVVRERAGKQDAAPEGEVSGAPEEIKERYKELAMVKHFTTLHWLERGGEFMSVATKAKIYDFMARAAEGMRNNSLTGTNGAELGVDVSVVLPLAPGVNLRPRVAATGTRTATVTQSRNLNGLSYTVSSGRGGAGELGLEAIFGADIGITGVGAFIGASGGYEESRSKGVTVRFKTDVVQDATGKHSYEQAEDPFLKDEKGNPVKLDASRVGMRRFFAFMKKFGEGEVTQAEGEKRLQDFMEAFAAEFLETRCLELTGTRQISRSVQITSRELIGVRVGTDDARAFAGVGSEQQFKAQTKVLNENSLRAAANNGETELYGAVRGIAGISLTPNVGTAEARLPGVNVLSAQATPVESSVNVQVKQQMKNGELDEYCTFQVTTVRNVAALRATLGPDIEQWQQYASGEPTLQKFLDEYSLQNKGDNSMFFQCIKNLRKPAVVKIRNYDSQLNGLETELVMARESGHHLRIRQLEMQIAHIRSLRNAVFGDDSNWKLYALSARQYIDRGDGNGVRFGVVAQKKKAKAITEEIEWFSWSFDTRAKEGRKMEARRLLKARVAQMVVPADQKDPGAWHAGVYETLCQMYGLGSPAAPAA